MFYIGDSPHLLACGLFAESVLTRKAFTLFFTFLGEVGVLSKVAYLTSIMYNEYKK